MKALQLCLWAFLISFSVKSQCTNDWLAIPTHAGGAGDGANIGNVVVAGTQLTVEATFTSTSAVNMPMGTPAIDLVSRHTGFHDVNFLLRLDHAELTTGVFPADNFFVTNPDTCPVQLNTVYHVAMTYDGAFLRFYRNGILIDSRPAAGNMNTVTAQPTRIGTETVSGTYNPSLQGYINHVRIWNVVRTQAQLQATMGAPLPAPLGFPGLLACYEMTSLTNLQGNAAFNGFTLGSGTVGQANPFCNVFNTCGVVCPADTVNNLSKCTEEVLTLNGRAGATYSWSPATGLSSTAVQNPVCTAVSSITYTLTVTQANGCINHDQYNVTVNSCHCEDSCNWSLTGNSNVHPWNFMGSLNNADVFFRRNNTWAGQIGSDNTAFGSIALNASSAGYNSAFGAHSLSSNTTGTSNAALGFDALRTNTVGQNNTAAGVSALFSNTTGENNTAIGLQSLKSNNTGYNNTAAGVNALFYNTSGFENTAIGMEALRDNTAGIYNSAIGNRALAANTTGNFNTAEGSWALLSNTTGLNNTANGYEALRNNNGDNNTASGFRSLLSNTTGVNNSGYGMWSLSINTTGSENTATGFASLQNNTNGYLNTATGAHALEANSVGHNNTATGYSANSSNTTGFSNTSNGVASLLNNNIGYYNTAAGYNSLRDNTSGYWNTANGGYSLYTNITGYSNSALGFKSGMDLTGGNNNVFIGYQSGQGITVGSMNTFVGANIIMPTDVSNTIVLADGAGTQRLYIDNNGFAGLATVTPTAALHVNCTGIAMPNPSNVRFENLPSDEGNYLVVDRDGYVFRSKAGTGKTDGREIESLKLQVSELQQQVKALLDTKANDQSDIVNASKSTLEIIPSPFSDQAKAVYHIDNFKGNTILQIVNSNGTIIRTYPVTQGDGTIEIGKLSISSSVVIFNIVSDGKNIISRRSVKI